MRHTKVSNTKRKGLTRALIVSLMIIGIVVSSVVTAVANSVDITVFDGEDRYSFSMIGADAESILARAETEGMKPVSTIDECVFSESSTVLTVQRNVRVSVRVDGEVHSLVVPQDSVLADALKNSGIELGAHDKIEPAADTVLTKDMTAEIIRTNLITVEADGERYEVELTEGTVSDALKAAGVQTDVVDTVSPAQHTPITDEMVVSVQRGLMVTVLADGKTVTKRVLANDAETAVAQAGVELGEDDNLYLVYEENEVLAARSTNVRTDSVLRVERITKETAVETEVLEFETVYKEVEGKYKDQETVVTRGKNGEKQVTYEVTFADGVEINRTVVSEEILSEAVDKVVERGTETRADSKGNGTFVDHTGTTVGYDWAITGECTAYSWEAGSVTAMGTSVQHGYVAVNPNVIPYGSLLYITSPNGEWNYGYCYAMDTGGAAMAGRIVADLFYDSEDYCNEFGRRQMTVYVVEEGKWPDGWK